MVVITKWLTGTKYPYFKWQWIFSLLRRLYLFSITDKNVSGVEYTSTRRVSYKKQELLTLREHTGTPLAFLWVRVSHLLCSLCYVVLCVFFTFTSCVLCTKSCQCPWIVHFWFPFGFPWRLYKPFCRMAIQVEVSLSDLA